MSLKVIKKVFETIPKQCLKNIQERLFMDSDDINQFTTVDSLCKLSDGQLNYVIGTIKESQKGGVLENFFDFPEFYQPRIKYITEIVDMLNAEIEVFSRRPSLIQKESIEKNKSKMEEYESLNKQNDEIIHNETDLTDRTEENNRETDSERTISEIIEEVSDKKPKTNLVNKKTVEKKKTSKRTDPILEEVQQHNLQRKRMTRPIKEVRIESDHETEESSNESNQSTSTGSERETEKSLSVSEKESTVSNVSAQQSSSNSSEESESQHSQEMSEESSTEEEKEVEVVMVNGKGVPLFRQRKRKRRTIQMKEASPNPSLESRLKKKNSIRKQKELKRIERLEEEKQLMESGMEFTVLDDGNEISEDELDSDMEIVYDGVDMEMVEEEEMINEFNMTESIPHKLVNYALPFQFFKSQHPLYKIKDIISFTKRSGRLLCEGKEEEEDYYVRFINSEGNDVFLSDVHLNGKIFKFKRPDHFDKEYDIGSVVIPFNLDTNTTKFYEIAVEDEDVFIVIMKCEKRTEQEIVSMVDFNSHVHELRDICKRYNAEYQERETEDHDDYGLNIAFDVSLLCPIGLNRIENPIRGKGCRHNACCDSKNLIKCCLYSNIWNCPICLTKCYYYDFVCDTRLKYFLSIVPVSVEKVSFIGDDIQIKSSEIESEDDNERIDLENDFDLDD